MQLSVCQTRIGDNVPVIAAKNKQEFKEPTYLADTKMQVYGVHAHVVTSVHSRSCPSAWQF